MNRSYLDFQRLSVWHVFNKAFFNQHSNVVLFVLQTSEHINNEVVAVYDV